MIEMMLLEIKCIFKALLDTRTDGINLLKHYFCQNVANKIYSSYLITARWNHSNKIFILLEKFQIFREVRVTICYRIKCHNTITEKI